MKTWSSKTGSAASTLLHSGYAIVRVEPAFAERLDDVFRSAEIFFGLPAAEKADFARPDILEGYRTLGAEFSRTAERPDLNETFAMVLRNQARPDLADWPAANPLHRALRAAAHDYVELVDGVLENLRRAINPEGDAVASAEFSYFQLNHYRPQRERRDLLQDAHEDGHLLTVVTARQPGLEIEVDGAFEAVSLAPDELLLMPGGILTLMTGGAVQPLLHRVRNVPGVAERSSLMFFVNPSLTKPPRAWAPASDGSYPDIAQATIESSQMFGLASIAVVAE